MITAIYRICHYYRAFTKSPPIGNLAKKTALDADNIQDGRVEQNLNGTVTASYDSKEMEEFQS